MDVNDIKPISGKLVVAGIFDQPLQIKYFVNLNIFVNLSNESDDSLTNDDIVNECIVIPSNQLIASGGRIYVLPTK